MNKRISSTMDYPSKFVHVFDSNMHYLDVGQGDPIIFLHGIPTSSYLWRNVIPYLKDLGQCIAPDLIGFGKSDKPAIEYSIFDHIKYLEKLIDTLSLKNITFVMHGWGSVIGFDYAMRHESNCKGLVFYEAFLRSLTDSEHSLPFQEQLLSLKDQANMHDVVTPGINFVDKIMPQHTLKQLTEEEMLHYREPFIKEGTTKPIFQYLKELTSQNEKRKLDNLIANYSKNLEKTPLPKLMLYSVPGFVTTIATVYWAREHLPNLEIIDIGEELHLAQESNPEIIGESISIWLQGVEQAHT